jgi:hypothetical protein
VRRRRSPGARDLPALVTCCSRPPLVYGHPGLLAVDPHTSWAPPPSQDAIRRAHATGMRRAEPRAARPCAHASRRACRAPLGRFLRPFCPLPVFLSCQIASLLSSLPGITCSGSRTGKTRAAARLRCLRRGPTPSARVRCLPDLSSFPRASLNLATPSPGCQDKPSPATDGRSGRPGHATPPAPVGPIPIPCTSPSRPLQVPIGRRARPRRAPVTGPPPASPVRRRGPNCFDLVLSKEIFENQDLCVIWRKYFEGPPANVLLGFQLQLRKIMKNRRKIIKMQIQFCWVRGEET